MFGVFAAAQVVGMSATVPNLQQLGAWLQAGCFEHDHRPVPLKQFVKVDPPGPSSIQAVQAVCGGSGISLKF